MSDDASPPALTPVDGGADGAPDDRLEEMARQYAGLIRTAVVRTAGAEGAAHADEIEQRVLLALWKQLQREQEIRHPASYLYRAAARETVRVIRGERRFEEKAEIAHQTRSGPVGASGEVAPDRAAESHQIGEQIRAAIATLQPLRRLAVQAHLMGHPVDEIMEMNGWTYQKARNLVARGMGDLRRELGARGITVHGMTGLSSADDGEET